MTEYLRFTKVGDTGKTLIWDVLSVSGGYVLGQIKWHGAWRQYCFYPDGQTIWNTDCLATVQAFIRDAMNERRIAQQRISA